MKRFCTACLVLILAGTGPVFAADGATTRPISLAECIEMAMARNFDLRIERYRQEYTKLSLNSERSVYDPRFQLSSGQSFSRTEQANVIGQFNPPSNESWTERLQSSLGAQLPWGTTYSFFGNIQRRSGANLFTDTNGVLRSINQRFVYTPNAGVNLTQPLLRNFLIDGPRYNIALGKNTLKQDEQSLRLQMIRVVTDVSIAYYDLIAAKEGVKVQQRAVELADRLVFERKRKVEIGTLAVLDGQEAESQAASRRADLLSARQNARQQENRLKQLINDNFAALDPVKLEPTASLDAGAQAVSQSDSLARALTQRPEIVRARLDLERQKVSVKFFKNQLYPQVDLTGTYGVSGVDNRVGPSLNDLSNQRNPNFAGGITLSYPLNNRTARNNLRQTRLQGEQLLLTYNRLEQEIMVDVANQVLAADTALERIAATRQAELFARAALSAEEGKLMAGKSTFFEILDKQTRLTQAEQQAIAAQTDYRKALERLAASEGSSLDRHGIQIQVK